MQFLTSNDQSQAGPRWRERHDRYDESLDEAPQLLEDEPVDMEQAIPAEEAEENESVEEIEDVEKDTSSVFIEGPPSRDEP